MFTYARYRNEDSKTFQKVNQFLKLLKMSFFIKGMAAIHEILAKVKFF